VRPLTLTVRGTKEARSRYTGSARYQADVRDYEEIHHHILEMADSLSDGIIKQFPRRFR
jgi:hypothetical protein